MIEPMMARNSITERVIYVEDNRVEQAPNPAEGVAEAEPVGRPGRQSRTVSADPPRPSRIVAIPFPPRRNARP